MTVPERNLVENIEIILLIFVVTIALFLNIIALFQIILTGNKGPTARTSFITGPYTMSSFTLFKLNLCITDFGILLSYGIVKAVWLYTFQWNFGNYGCKSYQFLQAFYFYANSNIIVSIGLDRLKVVYNRHVQGATSVKRVRLMLFTSWLLAFFCALPQLLIWGTLEVADFGENWAQCVTIFTMHVHRNISTIEMENYALAYELFHQSIVFWIPFLIISISYIFIVLKLLRYSFRPKMPLIRPPRSAESVEREPISQNEFSMTTLSNAIKSRKWFTVSSLLNTIAVTRSNNEVCKSISTDTGLSRNRRNSMWRVQLQSRVFKSVLCIVFAHILLWLPYNLISSARFLSEEFYIWIMSNGGNFLEDLIMFNPLINPLLYADTLSRRQF